MQGWLPNGLNGVRPAPVAIYRVHGKTMWLLYAMAPAPAGAPDPVRAVEPLGGDPAAARIVFRNGKVYEVRFTPGKPAAWKIAAPRDERLKP